MALPSQVFCLLSENSLCFVSHRTRSPLLGARTLAFWQLPPNEGGAAGEVEFHDAVAMGVCCDFADLAGLDAAVAIKWRGIAVQYELPGSGGHVQFPIHE